MSLTSCPTRPRSSLQKRRLGVIFISSRRRAKRLVHSLPCLSKSIRRMTSRFPFPSISPRTSRNDFPEDFAEMTSPSKPSLCRALMSFLPSTIIGVPLVDYVASLSKSLRILSSFFSDLVDNVSTLLPLSPSFFLTVVGAYGNVL